MSDITITPGEDREYTLTDGTLTVFSYDLMKAVSNTPVQTRALLQLLLDHKEEIEAAAQEQERQEAQPKQSKLLSSVLTTCFPRPRE